MRNFWRALGRLVFWSYERGSWPYDVMVLAIVLFVLVTPRSWFHDRPQTGASFAADVELISQDDVARTKTYRIDASALPFPKRIAKTTPELERETHDILSKSVDELKGRTFQIKRINPVQGDDGAVVYYDVSVNP